MQTAKKHESEDLLEREHNEKDNNDFIPISLLKKNA